MKTDLRASFLRWSGALSVWRWLHRKKVAISVMHGATVQAGGAAWQPLRWQLPASELDRYLSVLASYFEFITLDEAVAMISGRIPVRPNCLAFTIDDGYRNAFEVAWPVFKSHGIKPTVFVTTGYLRREENYWFDRLDDAIQQAARLGKEFRFAGESFTLSGKDRNELATICKSVVELSKNVFLDESARQEALETAIGSVSLVSDPPEPECSAMAASVGLANADEIRFYFNEGVAIGSHSITHPRLAFVEDAVARAEVTDSKVALEDLIGAEIAYFCYPEGSTSTVVEAAVRNAGYDAAFGTEMKLNEVGDNLFQIGRIHFPRSAPDSKLLCDMSGLTQALQQLKRRLLS